MKRLLFILILFMVGSVSSNIPVVKFQEDNSEKESPVPMVILQPSSIANVTNFFINQTVNGSLSLNISNGTTNEDVSGSEILNLLGSLGIFVSLTDTNFTFDLNFTLLNELYDQSADIAQINTTENIERLGFVTGNHTTGDGLNNTFTIYFDHSMNSQITYNLTEGDENEINVTTQPGRRFIFGSDFI